MPITQLLAPLGNKTQSAPVNAWNRPLVRLTAAAPAAVPAAAQSRTPAPAATATAQIPRLAAPATPKPPAPAQRGLAAHVFHASTSYRPPQAPLALRQKLATASGPAVGQEVAALRCGHKTAEAEALLAWAVAQPQHRGNVYLYSTWLSLVRADVTKLEHVRGLMAARGLQHDKVACSILIEAYGQAGLIERARDTFDGMQHAGVHGDVIAYSTLIKALARAQDIHSAWNVFDDMVVAGVAADAITYQTLVDLSVQAKDMPKARRALLAMERAGVPGGVRIYNTIMGAYVAAEDALGALQMQAAMQRAGVAADAVTYNALMQLCAQEGDAEGAQALIVEMKTQGLAPDVISYTTLMQAQCRASALNAALATFDSMARVGAPPNNVTYTVLINAHAKIGDVSRAWQTFVAMERAGIRAEAPSYGAIIDAHYIAALYDEGITRLASRVASMPPDARVGLAELYRKAKRYPEAIALCDGVLIDSPTAGELRNHAWIVKSYCKVLSQPKGLESKTLQAPPFDKHSLHWARYLCLRVFAGLRDEDISAQRSDLAIYNASNRGSFSRIDIDRALQTLDMWMLSTQ